MIQIMPRVRRMEKDRKMGRNSIFLKAEVLGRNGKRGEWRGKG
jgi:hypothetical protein